MEILIFLALVFLLVIAVSVDLYSGESGISGCGCTLSLLFIPVSWIYLVGCVIATVEAWLSSHSFLKTVACSVLSWAYVYSKATH